MAVDFQFMFPVETDYLLENMDLRIGCLSHVPDEHFRETLAQYFRRYPVNEWYPFNKAEMTVYKDVFGRSDSDAAPYPWQE